jgi:hypothetical protein
MCFESIDRFAHLRKIFVPLINADNLPPDEHTLQLVLGDWSHRNDRSPNVRRLNQVIAANDAQAVVQNFK